MSAYRDKSAGIAFVFPEREVRVNTTESVGTQELVQDFYYLLDDAIELIDTRAKDPAEIIQMLIKDLQDLINKG